MIEISPLYKERTDRLGLKLYVSDFKSDYLILRFWMDLVENDELKGLVLPCAHKLSSFMQLFQLPTIAVYSLGADGIDFIFWFNPASSFSDERSVFCGSWASKAVRGTPRQIELSSLTYEMIFEHFDNCIGTTWQPKLLELHTKIGYDIIGTMPETYGLDLVYLVLLKKERFYQGQLYRLAQRRQK